MFKFAVVTLLACALVASAARVPVEGETPYPLKAGWRVTEDLLEDKSEGKFLLIFFLSREFFLVVLAALVVLVLGLPPLCLRPLPPPPLRQSGPSCLV